MRINPRRAAQLNSIVDDITNEATGLAEILCDLSFDGVDALKGKERTTAVDGVVREFEDLCSDVRALARELGIAIN